MPLFRPDIVTRVAMFIDLLDDGRIAKRTHLYTMGPKAEITVGSIAKEGNTFLVKTITPRILVLVTWWRTSKILRLFCLKFREKFKSSQKISRVLGFLGDQIMIL